MPVPIHPLRTSAAAILVALSLAVPVAASDARPGVAVADTTAVRIDNFGRVNSVLYRGAQPEDRDYADLRALGVRTIINLTSDDAELNEKAMAESVGMRYVQIPMTTHTPPTPAQLGEFLRLVADPASQPVYVHCVGGRHRTGVMTAVYRIAHDGWTADQAFREMKQYSFGADFLHREFKNFVYSYRADGVRVVDSAEGVFETDNAGELKTLRPALER
jgi:tyrosine-protein phosphatase SIW14